MKNLPSISRRSFAQLMGFDTATAIMRPSLAWADAIGSPSLSSALVRLNSNENPYGPSPLALKAVTDAFSLVWRYPDEHADALVDKLADINGVAREQIVLGDGSGEILKICASAFTGPMTSDAKPIQLSKPTRGPALEFLPGRGKLIVADPTYEAIVNHARVNRAEVVKVPLDKNYAHDLAKMSAAADEGLIYICNPNNPTASITPKNVLREFVGNVSPKTMILVDEAYCHYADASDFETVMPLVKEHPNLIVARTFSKIYGMAGIRCGYCVTQPETIRRMRPHLTWDSVNVLALAAARASLDDAALVPNGRRLNIQTRKFVADEIKRMGLAYIPSQANFMMIDTKRPVRPLIESMNSLGVQVGRAFPSLPTHMRVTIGKQDEMEAFVTAFRKTMAPSATTANNF